MFEGQRQSTRIGEDDFLRRKLLSLCFLIGVCGYMEQKSYLRDFARYTMLSVLGTLGVSCYILADTFFVSKGLGRGILYS